MVTAVIAAVALPVIGGLHRYAFSYRYRGVEQRIAIDEAWKVAAFLGVISFSFLALRMG